jgi:hypothetical protein
LVVSATATGIGFGLSTKLGIALACLTVAVFGSFVVWAMREGRRRRAAGQTADVGDLQGRMRKYAKWGTILAALSVLTSAAAIATHPSDTTPVWVLAMPPVLITAAAAWMWLLVWVILPRLARKQASAPGGTADRVSQEGRTPAQPSTARRDAGQVALGLALVVVGVLVGCANVVALTAAGYGHITLTGSDRVVVILGVIMGLVIAVLGNLMVQRVRVARYRSGQVHTVSGILDGWKQGNGTGR